MYIKNISSSKIKIDDLEIELQPGQVRDFSHINLEILKTHKLLSIYFEKGILMNLGNVKSPVGSKTFMDKAKERVESSGIVKNGVVVKKNLVDRQAITNIIGNSTRRERIERTERTPKINIPEKKVETKEFQPKYLGEEGQLYFNIGEIPTSILTGNTTMLSPYIEDKEEEEKSEYKLSEFDVSMEKIKKNLERRCIGITSASKLCKRMAIPGFKTCLVHMTKEDKEKYYKLKQKYEKESK